MKQGLIYATNVDVRVARIARSRLILRQAAKSLRWVGRISWVFGLVALIYLVGPVVREEFRYAFLQTPVGQVVESAKNTSLEVKIIDQPQEVIPWTVPDMGYSIYIPKIGAKSRVIEGVDPWNQGEYMAALKQGVAAANGLANPGEKGTTYLFAHSVGSRADLARYNAIFYLLHKLTPGDRVSVVYKGKLHEYEVKERVVIPAEDLQFFDKDYPEERLVLQTCYPPGTSWKRLVIVANPTEKTPS